MGPQVSLDMVDVVCSKLSGAAGPDGVDSSHLRSWLLQFGPPLTLRHEVGELTNWLASSAPSWGSYCALMACRLVALDKQPGVRPLGVGNALRRLMAKLVLCVVGEQASQQCGNYNLCVGLKAGIKGAVHVICEAEAAAAAAALTADPTSVENSAYDDQMNGTQDSATALAAALAGEARAPPEQGT